MSKIIVIDDRPNDDPEVMKNLQEMWDARSPEEKEIVEKLLSGEIKCSDLVATK